MTQVRTLLPFVAGVTLITTLQVIRLVERVGWDAPPFLPGGFLRAWKAFFVTNFYRALQHFAFVWWSERGYPARMLRLDALQTNQWPVLGAFLLLTFAFGVTCQAWGFDYRVLRCAASVGFAVSLLHYWYDGFIWSVRRHEI